MQQLSHRLRPRKFSQVFAQDEVTAQIQQYFADHNDLSTTTVLTGDYGVGKTTLARIAAISLECPHQTTFGEPCKDCYRAYTQPDKYEVEGVDFEIVELNGEDLKIERLRETLQGAVYAPPGDAKYRTYIIDELQGLHEKAQKLLLKYFEDYSAPTTRYILCTTDPEEINKGILSRSLVYPLHTMTPEEVAQFTERLLTLSKSDLDPVALADVLIERRVFGQRDITQAVEKYLTGATPESAATVEGLGELDVARMGRFIAKGDWERLGKLLLDIEISGAQARVARGRLASYLQRILFDESPSRRRNASRSIVRLTEIPPIPDDGAFVAAFTAGLYDATTIFAGTDREED